MVLYVRQGWSSRLWPGPASALLIFHGQVLMVYLQILTGVVGLALMAMMLHEALRPLETRLSKLIHPHGKDSEPPKAPRTIRDMSDKTRTYSRMIKLEHTIFALPFALAALLLAMRQAPVTLRMGFWIVMAMTGARSAAMGFNRIADAHIDGKNPRTSERELPSGRMTVRETALFVLISSILFVLSSLFISFTCFWSSFIVLAFLFAYSFTKRFTSLSHIMLGVAIGLAPLGVWVAITDSLEPKIGVLSLALCTYIAGFDILYACQDIDFDRREGLHSLPANLGPKRALVISALLHVLTFATLASLYWLFDLTRVYLCFVGLIGILLVIEHYLVKPHDLSRIHTAFYHINSVISGLIFTALLTEEIMRRWAI
jgi:4-hydroxybenzoate polyprenyltransferase